MDDAQSRFGAVLYACSLSRLTAFYAAVADLTIVTTADDHVVLASPTFELTVVRVPDDVARQISITDP
ncbi:MAG TPA: hypothetical protein VGM78_08315, partial [Ilumatobacteraceae bacterium]